jgi:ArsR family metal-binding transcriptional regulator
MIREQYVVNLSDLVTFIDTEYKSFVSSKRTHRILLKKQKKIKAATGVTKVDIAHINKAVEQTKKREDRLRQILQETHTHLAVIIAQLRAVSIEVVEAIANWQVRKGQSTYLQNPPPPNATHSLNLTPRSPNL